MMPTDVQKQPFWKIYTPRNIYYECKYRLQQLKRRVVKNGTFSKEKKAEKPSTYDAAHALKVGQFYDTYYDKFLQVYGEVIQAFRTKDVSQLLDYQIDNIGFEDGQKVLDAGCGIGAPAIYFARHIDMYIDAITISRKQFEAAQHNVAAENLSEKITVVLGDYHHLPDYFPTAAYDVVYFLESFGHSKAKKYLIEVCWEMLKPGGLLYIKDLFQRIPLLPAHEEKINHEIQKINAAYQYDVARLNEVLDALRGKGFILASLKTIDLKLEDFENLAISNEFQELTGMALIENWDEYVFPVDFFELKCIKPQFNPDKGLDRYFLQNLYYVQVAGWDQKEL